MLARLVRRLRPRAVQNRRWSTAQAAGRQCLGGSRRSGMPMISRTAGRRRGRISMGTVGSRRPGSHGLRVVASSERDAEDVVDGRGDEAWLRARRGEPELLGERASRRRDDAGGGTGRADRARSGPPAFYTPAATRAQLSTPPAFAAGTARVCLDDIGAGFPGGLGCQLVPMIVQATSRWASLLPGRAIAHGHRGRPATPGQGASPMRRDDGGGGDDSLMPLIDPGRQQRDVERCAER